MQKGEWYQRRRTRPILGYCKEIRFPLLEKDDIELRVIEGMAEARLGGQDAARLLIRGSFHHADAGASYAVADTWGLEAGAAEMGSLMTGSVVAGAASMGAGVSVSFVGSEATSTGFSGVFSAALGEVLPLTVARSLANGDFGFSFSSSLVVAFSFLFNHGRELLRLSLLTAGVSVLASPLVTGVSMVSVGTVAGEATLVAWKMLENALNGECYKSLPVAQ